MPYSTQSDGESRYGATRIRDMADRTGDDVIDTPNPIESFIADADSLIDTFLASRYSVPLTVVPSIITLCSVDIWVYFLCQFQDVLTEEITMRYDRAIKLLKMLRDGETQLPVEFDTVIDATIESEDRLFTRCKLRRL